MVALKRPLEALVLSEVMTIMKAKKLATSRTVSADQTAMTGGAAVALAARPVQIGATEDAAMVIASLADVSAAGLPPAPETIRFKDIYSL